MLNDPWIAALVALFLWWFATGAILVVVKLADRRGPSCAQAVTWLALPLLLVGAWGVWVSAEARTPGAVYHAFLSALALWGWIELAFLTGVVTGPNRHPCRDGIPGWERFIRAWGTIAYHEMLLVAVLIGLALVLWEAANPYAGLTFGVLFVARVSAKLNLFLGVPKINTEFLPGALAHLPSHFRVRRGNLLFPLSIVGLTGLTVFWVGGIAAAPDLAGRIGHALLAAMTALALLEHWFMVLRLPDEKLWRWMLPAPQPKIKKTTTEDAHGL